MNREDFDFLNVNIMAISSRIFSKKSEVLISDMAQNMQDSEGFDSADEASIFTDAINNLDALGITGEDSDTLVKEGYDSLNDLKPKFDSAYKKLDADKFIKLLNALPQLQVNLKSRVTGAELEKCVDVLGKEENDDVFNELHQYSESLFYDPGPDIIMQALADESIDILIDNENLISNESITFENLEDAVLFNTPDILQWFAVRYSFGPNEVSKLVIMTADDGAEYFKKVLDILNPDETITAQIISLLEDDTLIQIVKYRD